jgi:F0F1-type ATP synthase assembly protein I
MVDDPASRRHRRISSIAQAYRDSQDVMSTCLSLGVCAGGGYWLDLKYGTKPLFILTGLTFGFVAAGFSLRRLLKRFDERAKRKRDSERLNERGRPD